METCSPITSTRPAQKVALIGANVATNLFGDTEPVGQKLRVGKIEVQVVGVLRKQGTVDHGFGR